MLTAESLDSGKQNADSIYNHLDEQQRHDMDAIGGKLANDVSDALHVLGLAEKLGRTAKEDERSLVLKKLTADINGQAGTGLCLAADYVSALTGLPLETPAAVLSAIDGFVTQNPRETAAIDEIIASREPESASQMWLAHIGSRFPRYREADFEQLISREISLRTSNMDFERTQLFFKSSRRAANRFEAIIKDGNPDFAAAANYGAKVVEAIAAYWAQDPTAVSPGALAEGYTLYRWAYLLGFERGWIESMALQIGVEPDEAAVLVVDAEKRALARLLEKRSALYQQKAWALAFELCMADQLVTINGQSATLVNMEGDRL